MYFPDNSFDNINKDILILYEYRNPILYIENGFINKAIDNVKKNKFVFLI